MKKNRIIALVLCLVCTLSLFNVVYAAEEKANLVKNSGAEADISGWKRRNTAMLSWEAGGSNGSKGCVKVVENSNNCGPAVPVTLIKGETYTVSFDIKTSLHSSVVQVIMFWDDNGYSYFGKNCPIVEGWNTVKFQYTFSGKNDSNAEVEGSGILNLRLGDGMGRNTYYVDNFQVISSEFVSDADNSDKVQKVTEYPVPVEKQGAEFNDMDSHWAYNNVSYLASQDILNGTGGGKYEPYKTVTRAEFIHALITMANVKACESVSRFEDVKDEWYADDFETAYQIGILDSNLIEDGYVYPERFITREEAVTAAMNYVRLLKTSHSANAVEITDEDKIASWAKQAVNDALKYGIVFGDEQGRFNPKSSMNRAEMAAILKRLFEYETRYTFYVDAENGDDTNDGSEQFPVQSFERAQALVRKVNQKMQHDVVVYFKGGEYKLMSTVEMNEKDSGFNGHTVKYTSYTPEDTVLFSGGERVSGWSLCDEEKNIYSAYVGGGVETRQMYVNGVRGTRAVYTNDFKYTYDKTFGYYSDDEFLLNVKNPEDVEFVYFWEWYNMRLGVKDMLKEGDRVKIIMKEKGWDNGNDGCFSDIAKARIRVENAYEFIDEEGEWYLDSHSGYLYYKPRTFENIHTAEVILPITEQFLTVKGSDLDNVVHNITFDNLQFKYATWNRPSREQGSIIQQNNLIMEDEHDHYHDYLPPAIIEVEHGGYINFEKCTFAKMGITSITFLDGVCNSRIVGNEFYDLSGGAMNIGRVDGDSAEPDDARRVLSNNYIANNYIHNTANEYQSASAIGAGFPNKTVFEHNEIFDTSYSGFHVGYGWYHIKTSVFKDTSIRKNYIHDYMNEGVFDGGGIYTLGGTGGTDENPNMIEANYVCDQKNKYGALYSDNGSQYWKFKNNVVRTKDTPPWGGNATKYAHFAIAVDVYNIWLENNWSDVENASRYGIRENINPVVIENGEWPEEALTVMDEAGLSDEYLQRYPDELQEVKILNGDTVNLLSGECEQLKYEANTRKYEPYSLDGVGIYFISDNENIAAVDENGVITAKNTGIAEISAYFLEGENLVTKTVTVAVNDVLDELVVDMPDEVYARNTKTFSVKGKTKLGREIELSDYTITNNSEDLLEISDNVITALNEKSGTAHVTVSGTYDGVTVSNDYYISVVKYRYGSGEKVTTAGYNMAEDIANKSKWKTVGNGIIKESENGLIFNTPSGDTNSCIEYSGKKFKNELLTFNLRIPDGSRWNGLAFRSENKGSAISHGSDEYIIIFTEKQIELYRFNDKVRTVIYGNIPGLETIGASMPYKNDCFKYDGSFNKIQLGAINEDDGVRIILNVNDVNIFDFLDTEAQAITDGGYLHIYAPNSEVEIAPCEE